MPLFSSPAPKGSNQTMHISGSHWVNGRSMTPPFASHLQSLQVGMGCFWGAERLFWQLPGVEVTAVGYSGGQTLNPSYHEVCTGQTGHAETVLVVYDPQRISLEQLLAVFFENHDPTQGDRQGNDRGSQYRSVLYLPNAEALAQAQAISQHFQQRLAQAGYGQITTELALSPTFYYAEEEHQQYLAKNPQGYCGLKGTGLRCELSPT